MAGHGIAGPQEALLGCRRTAAKNAASLVAGAVIENLQPPVEQLADGRTRPRISPLVHLIQQTSAHSFRLLTCVWTWRHDVNQVHALLGDGIPPDVNPDAESPRWQLVDGPALTLPPPRPARCHVLKAASCVMSGVTSQAI